MNIKTLILYFSLIFSCICCKNNEKPAIEPSPQDKCLYIFEDPEQFSQTQYYVWLPVLIMRDEPTKDATVLTKLKKGDQLEYLGIKTQKKESININNKVFEDNWLKVKNSAGIQGWVFGAGINIKDVKDDLSPTPYDDCFKLIEDRETEDFRKCFTQVQKQVLRKDSKNCYYTNKGIEISLLSGKKLSFENNSQNGKSEFDYLLYYPNIKQYVIHKDLGTLEEFFLVDANNGNKIETWGFPKISPDKNYIVSASNNYLFPGAQNGIQIMDINGKTIKKCWEREIDSYEPYSPKWLDNSTIGVTLKSKEPGTRNKSKFALIRKISNTEWKMEY